MIQRPTIAHIVIKIGLAQRPCQRFSLPFGLSTRYLSACLAVCLAVCLGFGICLWPQASPAQTLEAFLHHGEQADPAVAAKRTQWEAALEQAQAAGAWPNLQASAALFVLPVETRVGPQRARLGLMQPLPRGQELKAESKLAQAQAGEALARYQQARLEYRHQVGQAYAQLWALYAEEEMLEEELAWLGRMDTLATQRYAQGLARQAEVLQVQLRRQQEAYTLASLQLSISTRLQQFLLITHGNDSLQATAFPEGLPPVPDSLALGAAASDAHPEWQALQQQRQGQQQYVSLAQQKNWPRFNAGLDYVLVAPRTDVPDFAGNGRDALMPMLGVGIPLAYKKNAAAVRAAELRQEALALETGAWQENQALALHEATRGFYETKLRLQLYAQQRNTAQQALEAEISAYRQQTTMPMDGMSGIGGNRGPGMESLLALHRQLLQIRRASLLAQRDSFLAWWQYQYLTATLLPPDNGG